MLVVFLIASDWTLRTTLRAELRNLQIKALGMDSPDDIGQAIAAGENPSVIVLEGIPQLAGDPAIEALVKRVPTVLIASRTERIRLPPVAAVLYRPVRIAEIVRRVQELLQQPHLT